VLLAFLSSAWSEWQQQKEHHSKSSSFCTTNVLQSDR
jgi:hypothetical protein